MSLIHTRLCIAIRRLYALIDIVVSLLPIIIHLQLLLLQLPTADAQDDDGACNVVVFLPFTSRYVHAAIIQRRYRLIDLI
jgi:hypothetical protein